MEQSEFERSDPDTSPEQVGETRQRLHLDGVPEHSASANDRESGLDGTDIAEPVRPTRASLDSTPDPNDAETPLKDDREG